MRQRRELGQLAGNAIQSAAHAERVESSDCRGRGVECCPVLPRKAGLHLVEHRGVGNGQQRIPECTVNRAGQAQAVPQLSARCRRRGLLLRHYQFPIGVDGAQVLWRIAVDPDAGLIVNVADVEGHDHRVRRLQRAVGQRLPITVKVGRRRIRRHSGVRYPHRQRTVEHADERLIPRPVQSVGERVAENDDGGRARLGGAVLSGAEAKLVGVNGIDPISPVVAAAKAALQLVPTLSALQVGPLGRRYPLDLGIRVRQQPRSQSVVAREEQEQAGGGSADKGEHAEGTGRRHAPRS